MNNQPILQATQLSKVFDDGAAPVKVLHQLDLTVHAGERIAIVGPSGSGKSTLLHQLGGLDKPTSGQVTIKGRSWSDMSEQQRCVCRNQNLGFIYQFHHLLPEFSALENVAITLLLGGMSVHNAQNKAVEILEAVGLSHRLTHKPAELSGGERQRVAIARALVGEPQCILADEPTGNLDQSTAHNVFTMMLNLNLRLQTALVIVTHDLTLAAQMDRIMVLQDGQLLEKAQTTPA